MSGKMPKIHVKQEPTLINQVISQLYVSKQAYSIKTTWRNWKMKWEERGVNSMKWSLFKVPVKVEQIDEYLLSDTVQSK